MCFFKTILINRESIAPPSFKEMSEIGRSSQKMEEARKDFFPRANIVNLSEFIKLLK